jgi:hypothetical protein
MNPTDESGIREAIDYYADGMRTADVAVLRQAFHELATLCGYLSDELIAAPIQGLYDWVESNPAPEGYSCSILNIEITGRVATAKVRETDQHGDVIDHFHLLKVGDRWSIVSKIWDTEPAG